MYFWKHLKTINHHKMLVMKACFQVGLYRQGLLHDLSKYMPTEFFVGVKYYRGNMSPNNIERMEKGYSAAWLHHKGRNKHHLEYWIDYSLDRDVPMCGMRMPDRYIVEMFIDRMSASKNYLKEKYTDRSALEYYERSVSHYLIHPEVKQLLEELLHMLAEEGEERTLHYIRTEILKKNRKTTRSN